MPLPRISSAAISERVPRRADADVAARQLLGHDAHGFLAEPHAAVLLGDGEAEHAELGHLRNHIERNVCVAQVPLLGARRHLAVGELAHLLADRFERVVETAGADRRLLPLPHQRGEPCAAGRRVAGGDEVLDRGRHPRGRGASGEAEVGEPHDLALAHGDAAEDLCKIFPGADAHQEFLDLAEIFGRHQPLRIGRELPDGLDIGREPGETVRGALLAIEHAGDRATLDRHSVGDRTARVREQGLHRCDRLAQRRDQFEAGRHRGGGKRHKRLLSPTLPSPASGGG